MSYEIVNAIKDAENEGKRIIEKALMKSKNIAEEAKVQAANILEEGKNQGVKIKTDIVGSALQEMAGDKAKIQEDADLQIRYLKEKAKENQQNAIEFIVERSVS